MHGDKIYNTTSGLPPRLPAVTFTCINQQGSHPIHGEQHLSVLHAWHDTSKDTQNLCF